MPICKDCGKPFEYFYGRKIRRCISCYNKHVAIQLKGYKHRDKIIENVDNILGGLVIRILNYAKENEPRIQVYNTNGTQKYFNNKKELIKYLEESTYE